MVSILIFLRKKIHWLVFFILEGTSLFLVVQGNSYQSSVFFTQSNVVVSKILGLESTLLRYSHMVSDNRQLTMRNALMQRQIAQLREAVERLSHDSTETERILAESLRGSELIPARVTSCSVWQPDNMITIDCGSSEGVQEGMGVVCGTGIVGIVTQVGVHSSQVMSILNTRSSITCRIRGTGYIGYLHWQGGNMLVSTLDDVPHHARVRVGQSVETSGYSQVFPAGIFVGRIIKVSTSPDGLSFRLSVQLSVDMARLENVLVVKND